jgi:hypothetical protein
MNAVGWKCSWLEMAFPIVVPEDSNNSGAAQAEVVGGTDRTLDSQLHPSS